MALVYTLLTDGSSDSALLRIIDWLLDQHAVDEFAAQYADLSRLPRPPKDLEDRIARAVRLYPCDVLVVHRDAEREPRAVRVAQIREAAEAAFRGLPENVAPPVVCAVPVRMTEAWLLVDAVAIARTVGAKPDACRVPDPSKLELLSDPKTTLHDLIMRSSPLGARRRRQLAPHALVHRVADLIGDFSPLRELPAFVAFEQELTESVRLVGSR